MSDTGQVSEPTSGRDQIGRGEIDKDAVQQALEATATAVGEVATTLAGAVRQLVTTVGELGTELSDIRDAARRAVDDPVDPVDPAAEPDRPAADDPAPDEPEPEGGTGS